MGGQGSGPSTGRRLAVAAIALPLVAGSAWAARSASGPEETVRAATISSPYSRQLQDVPPQQVSPTQAAVKNPAADQPAKVQIITPKGVQTWTVSAMKDNDVPAAALRAYQNAAAMISVSDPGCRLPWTLLAAIGRVESDHGRYGGSVLGTDGVPRPEIIGIALNGVGPVAAIPDTDGGKLDDDTVWDRALGPMQFIPSTWTGSARDGDGDGVASPHDLDDAALAAAGYLCAGTGPVDTRAGMAAAAFRYNHDNGYVSMVLAFERGYRFGDFDLPAAAAAGGKVRRVAVLAEDKQAAVRLARTRGVTLRDVPAAPAPERGRGTPGPKDGPGTKSPDLPPGTPTSKPQPKKPGTPTPKSEPKDPGTPTPKPEPKTPGTPSPSPDKPKPSDPPSEPPKTPDSPAPEPKPEPQPEPKPEPQPEPDPQPEPKPEPQPEPNPDPQPEPDPQPDPSEPPPSDPPTNDPTEDPSPSQPAPSQDQPSPDKAPTTAAPSTTPELQDPMAGMLTACGGGYCVGGEPVQLPSLTDEPDARAVDDLDQDGTVEDNRAELNGVVDTKVRLDVRTAASGALVVQSVNGVDITTA